MPDTDKNSQRKPPLSQWDTDNRRLIDMASPAGRLVADKMREIVTRLLSASEGQYNIDDFDFVVSDDKHVQGEYIPADRTENGHNVICVSSGLIKTCKSEDEFASVIAHELGHFTYDQLFGKNTNSIYQERSADVHAVDLLIDGGYDPRAYLDVANNIFKRYKNDISEAFDVHGVGYNRVEDVKTKVFTVGQNGTLMQSQRDIRGYQDFQKQFKSLFKKSRYMTYLDRQMVEKLGTKEILPSNLDAVLDIMFDGVANNVDPAVLTNGVSKKLERFNKTTGTFLPSNRKMQNKMQRLVELLWPLGNLYMYSDVYHTVAQLRKINGKPFRAFGQVESDFDALQEFIDAPDADTAAAAAENLLHVLDGRLSFYSRCFSMPAFMMPSKKDARGATVPYVKHKKWAETNKNISEVLWDILKWKNFPDNKPYDYVIQDDVITHTGISATVYKREQEKREERDEHQRDENRYHDDYVSNIKCLDALADFDAGRIDGPEFWRRYNRFNGTGIVLPMLEVTHSGHNKTLIENDYKLMVNSPGYKRFVKSDKVIKECFGANKKDFMSRVLSLYNPDYEIIDALLKACDSAPAERQIYYFHVIGGSLASVKRTLERSATYDTRRHHRKYDKVNLNLDELPPYIPEKVALAIGWFMDMKEKPGRREIRRVKKYAEYTLPFVNENMDKVKAKYLDVIDVKGFFTDLAHRGGVMEFLWDEFECQLRQNQPAPSLDIIFQRANVLNPANPDEFYKNMKSLPDDLARGYYFAYCINNGCEIGDLDRILSSARLYKSECSASAQQDALSKYIERKKLFPENDFKHAFEIYKKMEINKWFSSEFPNHTKLLDILIRHIKTMSRDDREKYSFMLLTGIYDNGYRKNEDLRFPHQKNELMDIFVNAVYQAYGKDNGTPEYTTRMEPIIALINDQNFDAIKQRYFPNAQYAEFKDREILGKVDQSKLNRLLSDKIVSQEHLSKRFQNERVISINDTDAQNTWFVGHLFEGLLAAIGYNPDLASATIEFLNRRLTQDSVDKFRSDLRWNMGQEEIELMYNSFWTADLTVRAYFMNKLLDRIDEYADGDELTLKQIAYVHNMHFPVGAKYRDDALVVFKSVIMAFEQHERSLILAAIASANQNRDDEHKNAATSVGAGLRMFFENMGPAWVKFGQLMSYVPELPTEIRTDLGKLKDNADIPARWELFDSIAKALPNDLRKNIVSVDEILGAGSFWVTAKINFQDSKTGTVQPKVLSLLRPKAYERSMTGFETIERAVSDLAKHDKKYQSLLKVAQQARASAEYEVDVVHGNMQYEKAKELYGGLTVDIGGETFTPRVADWEYYGVGKDQVAYKLMDLANGKTLDRATDDENEKRKMALAYVTTELAVLFRGDVWDIDRHMGQQNFEKTDSGYNVNIYDTGAQIPKGPDEVDKVWLIQVLHGMVRAARAGRPLDEQILRTIKKMDRRAKLHMDTGYITDIQKGLMALSDIIEYQKAEKDADGNIIKPSLRLTSDDLANAVMAVYDNPTIDKKIKMYLAGMAFSDQKFMQKLRTIRGVLNSKNHEWDNANDNPVVVRAGPNISASHSQEWNKPTDEIGEIINAEKDNKILGIDKKYIKPSDNQVDDAVAAQQLALQRGLQIA